MAIDIDQSFYRTGTATVAANGTVVTGQGTLWTQTVRPGDMFGTHVGDGTRILTVNSNTSLTLAYPWKGAAQTALAYEIQFTPYDTGYQAAVRQLLQMLASGNVEAIAGLTSSQNTMSYFTGAGTAATTPLTPFARTLLDDASATTMLDTLGFSSFMRGQAGANSFAGWGVDNASNNVPNDNLNTLRTNGVYRTISSTVGAPFGFLYQVLHMGQAANYATQIAFPLSNALSAVPLRRNLVDNIWSDWLPFVAQRGSNANGEFVRLMDGTQICWGITSVNYNSSGSLITNWTYPAAFVGARETRSLQAALPVQFASYVGINPITPVNLTTRATNAGSGAISVYGTGFVAGNQINDIHVEATGRWF